MRTINDHNAKVLYGIVRGDKVQVGEITGIVKNIEYLPKKKEGYPVFTIVTSDNRTIETDASAWGLGASTPIKKVKDAI